MHCAISKIDDASVDIHIIEGGSYSRDQKKSVHIQNYEGTI